MQLFSLHGFILYKKFEKAVGKENLREIKKSFSEAKEIIREDYSSEKSISGMTNILMPSIQEDFPDLNQNLLFSKVEDDLTSILNSLENKDFEMAKNNENLFLIQGKLQEEIQDRKARVIR